MIYGVDAPMDTERRALPRLPANNSAMQAINALVEIAKLARICRTYLPVDQSEPASERT